MVTFPVQRIWKWIGHVNRKSNVSYTKIALGWTLEGKRKQGRAKTAWQRTVEGNIKSLHGPHKGPMTMTTMTKDCHQRRAFVAVLQATSHNGQ